ncbi:MAG: F-box protein [Alphaproteobacteria bacterium]|nr:F-box protein [Alphaproteobacteria bacterium]
MNISSCLSLFLSLSITSIACASHSSLPEMEERQKKVTTLETLHSIIRRERAREARLQSNVALSAFSAPSLIEIKKEPLNENEEKSLKRTRDGKNPSNTDNLEIHLPIKGERPFKGQKTKQGSIAIIAIKGEQGDDVSEWEWLPNELLLHVASFLSMKDLHAFKTVSTRAHRIYQSLITNTNFLTSDRPYAQDFRSIFSKVAFEPQPQAIRFLVEAKSSDGDIEVHFRDTKHLKQIVDQTPEMQPKENLYFVHDEVVKNGEELVSTSGNIEKSYFVHVVADKPLQLTGDLYLSCGIVFPLNTQWAGCNVKFKSANQGSLQAHKMAHELAENLDRFDNQLLPLRTQEAHSLMENQKAFRKSSPHLFPSLPELCPESLIVYDKNLEVKQKDYITAKEPLIYQAPSITALEELRITLPELKEAIAYINPNHNNVGVYCSVPLAVRKGFEVNAEGDIILWGKFMLKDYSFNMIAKGKAWFLGPTIHTSGSLYLTSGSMRMRTDDLSTKVPEMPDHLWRTLLRALGYVRLGY